MLVYTTTGAGTWGPPCAWERNQKLSYWNSKRKVKKVSKLTAENQELKTQRPPPLKARLLNTKSSPSRRSTKPATAPFASR